MRVQVLNVSKGTGLAAILNIDAFEEGDYLVMLSKNGLIKRTPLKAFTSVRASGIAAMKLKASPQCLSWVCKCVGEVLALAVLHHRPGCSCLPASCFAGLCILLVKESAQCRWDTWSKTFWSASLCVIHSINFCSHMSWQDEHACPIQAQACNDSCAN